jgi:16S rRNA (guanine527-N7)-methyltransferase
VKHGFPRASSPADEIGAAARGLGLDLGHDALRSLAAFERLLVECALPRGMVAASDASRIRERHVLDCLRAVGALRPGDRDALDLGSGAGLPGLVVAIARPDVDVCLVERRSARTAFLELAIERLRVPNASVLESRIEAVRDLQVDVGFARAFAPLPDAWQAARGLLRPGGRLVYFAGARTPVPADPAEIGDADGPPRSLEILQTRVLATGGPLIIMTR